uniref:Alanine--tRNA ligase n=1 Tax=Rhabditophanes sp. KR3021 TaxID=114890 RepID=A0AC35TW01_9BILA
MTIGSNQLRRSFINYFVKNGHTYVPSSNVVPKNDGSLLFTTAGMNQFKHIFLNQAPSELGTLKRAVNSQKCIRAGGKHNDLEDVGKDNYHHTFFEMLGNWSFKDYFKAEACSYAWSYLTQELEIDKRLLYVTYFGGDQRLGLSADLEAKEIWHNLGVDDKHIVKGNVKDNFWEMGSNSGPCGPCSEIHIDRIKNRGNVSHLVNQDDADVVEIWNLVFMTQERLDDGSLKMLKGKFIDCGMGFERLLSIMQNKSSAYDTDLFENLMSAIYSMRTKNGKKYGGEVGSRLLDDCSYRIVADHIRTISIAMADGVVPGNVDQGFLVKKLIRRAGYSIVEKLNCPVGSLSKLVPIVVDSLGQAYPELNEHKDIIINSVNVEEAKFWNVINRNMKKIMSTIISTSDQVVSGDNAWFLYNSLGVPLDTTIQIAESVGKSVDTNRFHFLSKSGRKKGNVLKAVG